MSTDPLVKTVTEAVASIEDVASHIEDTFAQVGNLLGRGHAIFGELNGGLASLSEDLSGAKIEGASAALQDVAAKLNGLAEALPSERILLGNIGTNALEASSLLTTLVKQIQMIMIIARSARIEAATLDADRDNFLDFTQEALNLANSVKLLIEGCARDQALLLDAIKTALDRQKNFENLYRPQLLSAGAGLISAYSGMQDQQNNSARLAALTSTSTKRITEAVGSSIISLQAGDSTRQRLEHICSGLRIAAGSEASLVPAPTENAGVTTPAAQLICQLQAAQLNEAVREFDIDIGQIGRSLTALFTDATGIVTHGRSLYGGQDGDTSSVLVAVKQTLAQALTLIDTCESAGKSVDDALSVVEDTLQKFRRALSGLSETVVDIILIGMNASLKAGHLGVKGSAFVVIANELKITADHISKGAGGLQSILDGIEKFANDLKRIRVDGDPSQLAMLEPSILLAIQKIEAGNDQLGQLMSRLNDEGAQFESLITGAQTILAVLGSASKNLPGVVASLRSSSEIRGSVVPRDADGIDRLLDDLYARYTMVGERDVHLQFLKRFGLTQKLETAALQDVDDVLLF
jgi:hypothetical protein